MYVSKPIKELFHQHLNDDTKINNWIASGKQLRLATVGLDSGELCYVTETGDLIDREQKILLASGLTPIEGGMASSAIASIFPPVKFTSIGDNWVDGGHREYAPLKAALDMGATEVYVICAGPVSRLSTVNYTEDGKIPTNFDNKSLVDIAVRAILDITGDETATNDVFPLVEEINEFCPIQR